eukprot:6207205-Pleurochrysis_carterae.AAC.4
MFQAECRHQPMWLSLMSLHKRLLRVRSSRVARARVADVHARSHASGARPERTPSRSAAAWRRRQLSQRARGLRACARAAARVRPRVRPRRGVLVHQRLRADARACTCMRGRVRAGVCLRVHLRVCARMRECACARVRARAHAYVRGRGLLRCSAVAWPLRMHAPDLRGRHRRDTRRGGARRVHVLRFGGCHPARRRQQAQIGPAAPLARAGALSPAVFRALSRSFALFLSLPSLSLCQFLSLALSRPLSSPPPLPHALER